MSLSRIVSVFLLIVPSLVIPLTVSLKRSAGIPKYFYQARSLIVCKAKCVDQCNDTVFSLWRRFSCNRCLQQCIRHENMVHENGPQDRGLIISVEVCCARLITYSHISAKITFHYSTSPDQAFAVLEYRFLSDADDLHDPSWIMSQIIRERSLVITELECGYLYQFRVTLITTRVIDRRTSSWISFRDICRYGALQQ